MAMILNEEQTMLKDSAKDFALQMLHYSIA